MFADRFVTEQDRQIVGTLQACTALIGEGGEQAIIVRIPKPSSASPLSPYNIVVSGVEDSSIEVSVP